MKLRTLQLVLLLSMAASLAHASQVIDRIVAVVNGKPLLQSDWSDEVRFEALQQGRAATAPTGDIRRGAFDRMIEQELIRQQMQGIYTPDPDAIQQRERDIRELYPQAQTDADWEAVLASFGFDRATFEESITAELQTWRFIDIRLRPTVKVEPTEVESYYREHVVPEVRKRGEDPDPLPSLSARIHDLLVEQRINQVFVEWIASLRAQSKIEVFTDSGTQPVSTGN
jgi:hypothetical protein